MPLGQLSTDDQQELSYVLKTPLLYHMGLAVSLSCPTLAPRTPKGFPSQLARGTVVTCLTMYILLVHFFHLGFNFSALFTWLVRGIPAQGLRR